VAQNEDHIERMRHLITGLKYFDVHIAWKILTQLGVMNTESDQFLTMSQFTEKFKSSEVWTKELEVGSELKNYF
jgi:hypothetical protein